jgi:osmotically-inducible protein OsmY
VGALMDWRMDEGRIEFEDPSWAQERERADRPDHRGKGPRRWRSDLRIHEDVCDALVRDAWVDASEIEVSVQDGEVTLSGTVASRDQKCAAERVAERVTGVVDVHNRLRLQLTGDRAG